MSEYSDRRISDALPKEWQETYSEIKMTVASNGEERYFGLEKETGATKRIKNASAIIEEAVRQNFGYEPKAQILDGKSEEEWWEQDRRAFLEGRGLTAYEIVARFEGRGIEDEELRHKYAEIRVVAVSDTEYKLYGVTKGDESSLVELDTEESQKVEQMFETGVSAPEDLAGQISAAVEEQLTPMREQLRALLAEKSSWEAERQRLEAELQAANQKLVDQTARYEQMINNLVEAHRHDNDATRREFADQLRALRDELKEANLTPEQKRLREESELIAALGDAVNPTAINTMRTQARDKYAQWLSENGNNADPTGEAREAMRRQVAQDYINKLTPEERNSLPPDAQDKIVRLMEIEDERRTPITTPAPTPTPTTPPTAPPIGPTPNLPPASRRRNSWIRRRWFGYRNVPDNVDYIEYDPTTGRPYYRNAQQEQVWVDQRRSTGGIATAVAGVAAVAALIDMGLGFHNKHDLEYLEHRAEATLPNQIIEGAPGSHNNEGKIVIGGRVVNINTLSKRQLGIIRAKLDRNYSYEQRANHTTSRREWKIFRAIKRMHNAEMAYLNKLHREHIHDHGHEMLAIHGNEYTNGKPNSYFHPSQNEQTPPPTKP